MKMLRTCGMYGGFLLAFGVGFLLRHGAPLQAQVKPAMTGWPNGVFELRIVTLEDKVKRDEVLRRYRAGQVRLWEKHGMKPIGFWVATEMPKSENTIVFIHAHKSREAADQARKAFADDPEWKAFPKPGDIGQAKIESIFMAATDFSPIQ